jgi:hypothetical protein
MLCGRDVQTDAGGPVLPSELDSLGRMLQADALLINQERKAS